MDILNRVNELPHDVIQYIAQYIIDYYVGQSKQYYRILVQLLNYYNDLGYKLYIKKQYHLSQSIQHHEYILIDNIYPYLRTIITYCPEYSISCFSHLLFCPWCRRVNQNPFFNNKHNESPYVCSTIMMDCPKRMQGDYFAKRNHVMECLRIKFKKKRK